MVIADIEVNLNEIEEPWFIYAMGEQVKPIIYSGDRHDYIQFYCDLQRREGGLRTRGYGATLAEAIFAAWALAERGRLR